MLYEGDERNSRVSGGGSREHFIHIPDALERTRERACLQIPPPKLRDLEKVTMDKPHPGNPAASQGEGNRLVSPSFPNHESKMPRTGERVTVSLPLSGHQEAWRYSSREFSFCPCVVRSMQHAKLGRGDRWEWQGAYSQPAIANRFHTARVGATIHVSRSSPVLRVRKKRRHERPRGTRGWVGLFQAKPMVLHPWS